MTELASTLGPVFGIVAGGFIARRVGLLGPRSSRALVFFVFNAALPVLLFRSMAGLDFPERIEWGFLGAFYGGAFATYGAGIAVAHFAFGRPRSEWAIHGMGAGFSNTVLLGIPILLGAFGADATLPVLLIIAFHSVTLLPVSVALIHAGKARRGTPAQDLRRLAFDIAANPIILGLTLGLLANVLGFGLPGPVDAVAAALAGVAIPCALVALGASLAGYPLEGAVAPALTMASLKLVLHPALVWIVAVPILDLGAPWAPVAVVMAGMPSGAMVYLFGARYDAAPKVAALTVVVASALSVVTISVWLSLMGG